jgi:hypothetical protein
MSMKLAPQFLTSCNPKLAQKWRATFCPKGYISEDEVKNELDAKKACLQGKDKLGQPFAVSLVKNHYGEMRDLLY